MEITTTIWIILGISLLVLTELFYLLFVHLKIQKGKFRRDNWSDLKAASFGISLVFHSIVLLLINYFEYLITIFLWTLVGIALVGLIYVYFALNKDLYIYMKKRSKRK